MESNVYVKNGYHSRDDYLNCLADDYGLTEMFVHNLASVLGEDKDFDGLVSALNDYIDDMEG